MSRTEPAIAGPRSLRDPRSREYAIQTMRSLKRFLESKSLDAKSIKEELQRIIQHKHWEVCGFRNVDAYLQAEVGTSLKLLERRLAQDLAADASVKPLATEEEARLLRAEGGKKGGRGKRNLVANGHKVNQLSSNSAERIVRRLKRDHPEIAEALAEGKLPSARAAAIAAGIVRPQTPLDQLRKAWGKATADERNTFLSEVTA